MPRLNPTDKPLFQKLYQYKITSLSLYGTGETIAELANKFIFWLTSQLKTVRPIIEFISLKNLNLSDVENEVWTGFLALCGVNCKFSVRHFFVLTLFDSFQCINCTFPRLSMVYQLYTRVPLFEYLTETYTIALENDLPEEKTRKMNQRFFQQIAEGTSTSMDLSSIAFLSVELLLDFITVSSLL